MFLDVSTKVLTAALIRSGSFGQAETSCIKSGYFSAKSAKKHAKSFLPFSVSA
jgi:hypothetical protein